MEPKSYQTSVLKDLDEYLAALDRTRGIHAALKEYWNAKGVPVNAPDGQGVPGYFDDLAGVPNVCIKVPTGGGKTFLAACSIRSLFDRLPAGKIRFVMWLVPSDAILTQTVANLSNPGHPYRQRLDRDFGGRVNVYTKEQLLNGQNFKPGDVTENLSVCVFCYASIRTSQLKKDDKKIYQENGNLLAFADVFKDRELLLADTPETALMNVIRQMNPVVVVDESHNAKSDLSLAMLRNLNPSFVLAMTATPTDRSNILSYVDARALKRENMVKLPVVVYNRPDRGSVVRDAVKFRELLEAKAQEERKAGGAYIRPIVLFQAQPKTSDDAETFAKIKSKLVDAGIPEKQIAIKTAQKDELNGVNLLSETCPIRYVVTVNALKEGWDCPFAYVLASLANKTSRTDVEQIVGRILRQPFARSHGEKLLNMSYVLTCSSDFEATIQSVIAGLNGAGFSSKDYRVAEATDESAPAPMTQLTLPEPPPLAVAAAPAAESGAEADDDFSDVPATLVAETADSPAAAETAESLAGIVAAAVKQGESYEKAALLAAESGQTETGVPTMKQYPMGKAFAEALKGWAIPQFAVREDAGLFSESEDGVCVPFEEESLMADFSLAAQDATVSFNAGVDNAATVDISKEGDVTPKSSYLSAAELAFFSKSLDGETDEKRLGKMADMVSRLLDKKIDFCQKREVSDYVRRVILALPPSVRKNLSPELLVSFSGAVLEKIRSLAKTWRRAAFIKRINANLVECVPLYALPPAIAPSPPMTHIDKSLYVAEWGNLNNTETEVIRKIAAKGNVKWWHRIKERSGFCINAWRKHYPDFMVMTEKGTLVLVEVKGPQLDGSDSQEKCEMGSIWANQAGPAFKYFMVFLTENEGVNVPGSTGLDDFLATLEHL